MKETKQKKEGAWMTPKDYILHEIYKVLPELFEDET